MGPKKEQFKTRYSSAKPQEPNLVFSQRVKLLLAVHWKGVAVVAFPIIFTIVLWYDLPVTKLQWVVYSMLLMASFWMTECIPMAVTSVLPVAILPLVDAAGTKFLCIEYMSDSTIFFLGAIYMAFALEQSGLHRRLAYCTMQHMGYSHLRLLGALCFVTCFASMWITNTAVTTMMTPINFALLKVFEDQGVIKIYEKTGDGDLTASDVASSYFCAVTFSATVGGIGTLIGTITNLVCPGYLNVYRFHKHGIVSFKDYSSLAVPIMIILEFSLYMWFAIVFFGFLRPNSVAAKNSKVPITAQQAVAAAIDSEVKKKGYITYYESMVFILFVFAVISFFTRGEDGYYGWGDRLVRFYKLRKKSIRDCTMAMLVALLMFILPRDTLIFQNFSAKYKEDLPKSRSQSILNWAIVNAQCPYSYAFIIGGGQAIIESARIFGIRERVVNRLEVLQNAPSWLIILVLIIFIVTVTNFGANLAVAALCIPIAFQVAKIRNVYPMQFCFASGLACNYCFLTPAGTPGNTFIHSIAKVSIGKMFVRGIGPTVSAILITWLAIMFWAEKIWPEYIPDLIHP